MIRRALRVGALVAVAAVLGTLLLVVGTYFSVESRMRRTYPVAVGAVMIPSGDEAIARGEHLVVIGRCRDCHGGRLQGFSWEDSVFGRVHAPNLTSGEGGIGRTYGDEDWVRSIRHGIGPDGRSLMVTPAQFYYHLSDDDLGAMIAYLKQLRPVNSRPRPEPELAPVGRLLVALTNQPDWFPAERIDHDGPRPPVPATGPTAAYGAYIWNASTCGACHTKPDALADEMAALGFDQEGFARLLRFGLMPDGRPISAEIMPRDTQALTPLEVEALWHFLVAAADANGTGRLR